MRVGLSFVLLGLCVYIADAAYNDVHHPDIQHDNHGILGDKSHESSWNRNLDQNHPKMKHEVEYGFKRGHGHENMRGDFEVDNLDCPTMCTFDLKPVCGSDGRTYDNKCLLDTTACKSRKYIYVAKQGGC